MGKARAKTGKDDTSQSRHGAVDECSTNVRGALHSRRLFCPSGSVSRALSHLLSFQRTQDRNSKIYMKNRKHCSRSRPRKKLLIRVCNEVIRRIQKYVSTQLAPSLFIHIIQLYTFQGIPWQMTISFSQRLGASRTPWGLQISVNGENIFLNSEASSGNRWQSFLHPDTITWGINIQIKCLQLSLFKSQRP